MKKTIACVAMIGGAISSTALAGPAAKKTEERKPASYEGYTFAGCRPAYAIYQGDEAYKNNCTVPLQTITVPQGGFSPPGSNRQVAGCDDKHQLVVSSTPIRFVCLPPGAVEL